MSVTVQEKFLLQTTPQEKRIISLLLGGCSNKEIADTLHMKERTVKLRFSHLFKKFEIKPGGINRVRLAVKLYRAIEFGEGVRKCAIRNNPPLSATSSVLNATSRHSPEHNHTGSPTG